MRTFLAVTQQEIDDRLAETIRSREFELAAYDFEKANHEAVIASLGDIAWTPEFEKYKGLPRDEMLKRTLDDGLTEQQRTWVANLATLDQHRLQLEAVKIETAKSERHYTHVLTELPAGTRRTSALARLATRTAEPVAR